MVVVSFSEKLCQSAHKAGVATKDSTSDWETGDFPTTLHPTRRCTNQACRPRIWDMCAQKISVLYVPLGSLTQALLSLIAPLPSLVPEVVALFDCWQVLLLSMLAELPDTMWLCV